MFNEFFGRSVNLFQSKWHTNLTYISFFFEIQFSKFKCFKLRDLEFYEHSQEHGDHIILQPEHRRNVEEIPYPVGVDPVIVVGLNLCELFIFVWPLA